MATLLITDIFPPQVGGSGRWFWEIYRRLPRAEYVIAAGEDPQQAQFDGTHDLRVTRLPLRLSTWGVRSLRGLRGYGRAVRRLKAVIRSERVRRLHCARCLPEGLMAWVLRKWLGLRYACYAHGEELHYATGSRELSWLARRALRGADLVIANSHNTARILHADWGLGSDQVRVLHPGVDIQRFRPAERDDAIRARLGWGDRPVVLTVGRLQRRKGQDRLIKALGRIRKAIPNVLYAIVGQGEERAYLQQLAASEEHEQHVQFLGEAHDASLIECYQQCDLFALPNRQVEQDIEGFGMVLLEAQACGKPVLAGDSGGTAETMRIPETGRTVNCESPEPLAEAVIELLSDRERRIAMGRAARQWVVERFDWTPLSEEARRLFAEIPCRRRTGMSTLPAK